MGGCNDCHLPPAKERVWPPLQTPSFASFANGEGGNRCQPPPAQEDHPASQPAGLLPSQPASPPSSQPAREPAGQRVLATVAKPFLRRMGVCNGCQRPPSQDEGVQPLPIPTCGEEEEGERGEEDDAVEGEVEEAWEEEEQGEEEEDED